MALDVEIIKVMVMLWFMAAASYAAYKLYKKYVQNRMTQQATLPTAIPGQVSHEQANNALARILPVFKSHLPNECRAGGTVSLEITFPSILKRQTYGVELQNQLSSLLSVKIFLQNNNSIDRPTPAGGGAEFGEIIPVVFEYQPFAEGDTDVKLLLKFSVKTSGLYEIDVKYSGYQVRGTPCFKEFFPGTIHPDSTILQRKSPAILCVTDVSYFCVIEPKDKHNNLCRIQDVDMDLFSIKITELEPRKKDELVEPITYSFYQDTNDWGIAQKAVRLQLELFRPGMFQGMISYKDCKILNGTFEIVCLNSDENDKFRKILLENPGAAYHEANLVYLGLDSAKVGHLLASGGGAGKQRKVYVYVAPQVLSVKEFYFGFIPAQLASYRIIPATRIQLIMSNEETGHWALQFTDRMQPKCVLELDASHARIVTALFQFFLQQRLGGSESFENKQRFFHQELRKVMSDKTRASPLVINICRDQLLESTLRETRLFGGKDWCRKFKIKFVNEAGADEGGLRREWLDMLCREIFDGNERGMFRSLGNSRLVIPNCDRDSAFTLKHYELAGLIVGKCMFETAIGGHFKQMVNARFGRSFLAQIIGFPPHFKYFEKDDPELYESKIKYILDSLDVSSMDLTFTEEVYKDGKLISVIDLIPNGSQVKVTLENKLEYLQALAQYRLYTQVRKEIQSFNKGLNSVVPFGLLTNFDENELEILMCGQSTITVEDMKNHHVVTPCNELHCTKIVAWFWTAVENMTESERTRLLQFTTGSSLLPHGGFQCLEPRFRITVYGTVGKLPIAHTCFNEICLSNHSLYEDFEKALKTAITEGNEGFSFH